MPQGKSWEEFFHNDANKENLIRKAAEFFRSAEGRKLLTIPLIITCREKVWKILKGKQLPPSLTKPEKSCKRKKKVFCQANESEADAEDKKSDEENLVPLAKRSRQATRRHHLEQPPGEAGYSADSEAQSNAEDRPLPQNGDQTWAHHETDEAVPFVFVADNAFPLTRHCRKPYPEKGCTDRNRVFNYRLSRFRRVSENAFGIMTAIFRIFGTKIYLHPDKAVKIVKAALVLHNMLRCRSPESFTPTGFADEIVGEKIIDGTVWNSISSKELLV
eukprot:gene3863-4400_t